MELRRDRGVATVVMFPLVDGAGNLATATGVVPQIATWTSGFTTAPEHFINIAGGLASISNGLAFWSSLTATEMANDYIYYIASPTSGTARAQIILINCTAVASVTRVATVDQVMDLRTTTFPEVTAVPAATSTIFNRIGWIFALSRNQITQSAATQRLTDDATTGTISTAAISTTTGLFTRGEWS